MSDLKYVLIEMIENDVSKMDINSIIAGVFRGIRVYQPPKEDRLIIIEKKDNTTFLLNTMKYNVLSLQKFDGYTKIIHCFRATIEDQKLASDMLSDVIKELNEAGRTISSDDNIIDTTTYTCIPSDITIIKDNSNVGSTNHKTPFCNNRSQNRSAVHIKKGPKPKCFKRNKKPGKDTLSKMQKKIDKIKAGTYKVKLPIVKGDDIEISDVNSNANNPYDDSNFYMHG